MRFQTGQNTGEANCRWKGDLVSDSGGRQRARRMYASRLCQVADCENRAERHHIDGNTRNNDASNIAFLCNKHHKEADGRMHRAAFRMAQFGKRLTAEHRAKIGASLVGRPVSEATRGKISSALCAHNADKPRPLACPHGHAYTEANTTSRGTCRDCDRARSRRNYYARKAAAQ